MEKLSGKILLLVLALAFLAGGFLVYLKTLPENAESPKTGQLASVIPPENPPDSAAAVKQPLLSETPSSSADQISEQSPAENFEASKVKEAGDRPGQLVRHLFDVYNAPSAKALAFSPDGKEIWATLLLNQKRGVAVFDAQSGQNIKNINLQDGGGVEMVFSKNEDRAYVSQMETASVFEIDAQTKEILRTFDTKSSWTKEVVLSEDQNTLYASNWVGDDVSEISLSDGKTLRNIKSVDTPRGIYATGDGKFLYVAGFGRGEIQKINLQTATSTVLFKSGGAMRHIIADEEKNLLFISDMGKNAIWQLSLDTDEVEKFAETDYNPNTIALSPDGKILYVSCRGINASPDNYYIPGPEWGTVLLFDAASGKMLDAIIGGNQPTGLAISPDGRLLVFSDFLDSRLEFFQVPSYEELLAGNGGRSSVYLQEIRK